MDKYMYSKRVVEDRVDDLISQMTVQEKVSQMVHDAPAIEWLT